MRPWIILSCLLLVPPPSAPACDGYTAEATPTLSTPNRTSATWGAEAEEAAIGGAWLAAAGAASLAMVLVAFRAFRRASGPGPVRPVECEPAAPEVSSAPARRPGEPWIRIDPGQGRPEPIGPGREDADVCAARAEGRGGA